MRGDGASAPPDWLAPGELSDALEPAPIGWYPDPAGGDALRLWDGRRWTQHLWFRRAGGRFGATGRGGARA